MVDGAEGEDEKSSPLLQNERPLQPEGDSPRALPAQASPGLTPRSLSSFSYRMPTFPRNVSVCQLAGGASEEESKQHKQIQRKLIAALILAFIFMLVEVVGGVMAHSLAIITDAAHLLSDVSGFAVAVLAAFWAKRKSQEHFSYGYHRVEVLGALASVMTVWLVTGILLFEAVQRIITPEPVDGKLMFIIAVIGVGVNILMMAVLGHNHGGQPCSHSHGHSHDHSHSHAPGHGCGGHSHAHGKSCSKRQLAPALEVAAEMSRSNSRAGGCCNGHGHGHTHAHKCSEDADLEAGHAGHAHAHSPHGSERIKSRHHNHHHCSSEEHGHTHVHDHSGDGCADHHHHCSSDEEEAELLASGRAPILAGGPRFHEANGQEPGPSQGHAHSHDHGKPHGGGGDHSQANLNMRGAIIHVIGDFVQSIGVAIAGALIWWHQDDPRWYIADPICTFLFAILVLWTTRAILRDISDVLMERVPRGFCIKTLHDDLSRVPGVESVADLHVWSLTPGIPLLCAHVGVADGADPTDVLHALTAHCRSLGIEHSTIQLMSCGAACDAC